MNRNKARNVFKGGASDREKVGRFVAGSSALFIASVLSGGLCFLWTVLMSRLLGPEGFGVAGPFLNLFWILTLSVSFGVPHAMVTFVSDCYHTDAERASRVISEGTRLLFILLVVFTAVAALSITVIDAAGGLRPLTASLSWIMIAAVAGRQMYFAIYGAFGGLQRMDALAVCNTVFPAAMVACSTVFVMLARELRPGNLGAGVIAGAGGVAVATFIQFAVSLAVAGRVGVSPLALYSWRRSGVGARRLLSFGWLAATAVITLSGLQLLAPVVLSYLAHSFGYFGTTPGENAIQAGWFSGAFTYAMAPMLIVGMVLAIVPAISEAQSQGKCALMQRYFDLAVRYALSMIFFTLSVYAAYGGKLVELFSGERFPAAVMGPMTISLAAGLGLCMISMLASNVLIGAKRPGVAAAVGASALAAEVAALAAACRITGSITYAAAAFDAVTLGAVLIYALLLRMKLGLYWTWHAMSRPIIAAAATAAILLLFPAQGATALAGAAASLPIYFILLGFTGGIESEDFDMTRDTLRSVRAGFLAPALDLAEKILSYSPLFQKNKRDT